MCVPRRILRFPVSLSVPLPHQLGGFGCPCPPLPLGPGRSMVGGCFHPMMWGSSDVPPHPHHPPPRSRGPGVSSCSPPISGVPLSPPHFGGPGVSSCPFILGVPHPHAPPFWGVPCPHPASGVSLCPPHFGGPPVPPHLGDSPVGPLGSLPPPSLSFWGWGVMGSPPTPRTWATPPGWRGGVGGSGGAAGGSGWGGGRAL